MTTQPTAPILSTVTLSAGAKYGFAGKQFVARITGRHPKFTFAREFVGGRQGKRGDSSEATIDEEGLYQTRDVDKHGSDDSYYLIWRDGSEMEKLPVSKETAMSLARALDKGDGVDWTAEGRTRRIAIHEAKIEELQSSTDARVKCSGVGQIAAGEYGREELIALRRAEIARLRGEVRPVPGSAPDTTGAGATAERIAAVEIDGPPLVDEQVARLRSMDTVSRIAFLSAMTRPELVTIAAALSVEHYRVRRDRLEGAILRAVETPPAAEASDEPVLVVDPPAAAPGSPVVDPELPILGTLPIGAPGDAPAHEPVAEERPLAILGEPEPAAEHVAPFPVEAVDEPAADDVPVIASEPAPAAQDDPQDAIEPTMDAEPQAHAEEPAQSQAEPAGELARVAAEEPAIAEILQPATLAPRALTHEERYPQGCPLHCSDCAKRLGIEGVPGGAVVVEREPVRDPRLPAPGSVIRHLSRGVEKASAIVRTDGIEYAGTLYRGVNAAAKAAAADLGLAAGERNGYEFWGLTRRVAGPADATPRARRSSSKGDAVLVGLGTAFDRYALAVAGLAAIADPEERARARALVRAQMHAIEATLDEASGTAAEAQAH